MIKSNEKILLDWVKNRLLFTDTIEELEQFKIDFNNKVG